MGTPVMKKNLKVLLSNFKKSGSKQKESLTNKYKILIFCLLIISNITFYLLFIHPTSSEQNLKVPQNKKGYHSIQYPLEAFVPQEIEKQEVKASLFSPEGNLLIPTVLIKKHTTQEESRNDFLNPANEEQKFATYIIYIPNQYYSKILHSINQHKYFKALPPMDDSLKKIFEHKSEISYEINF